MCRPIRLAVLLACLATGAQASSSDWHETEGVRMRLVTKGMPTPGGALGGALQIELQPGWKTYWRDPGASGVPPAMDLSKSPDVTLVEIGYPAPTRFDDASGIWVGYKHSVAFPVTFRAPASGSAAKIDADVFIGVCQDICIPVQASLAVDTGSDPENVEHAAIIEAAMAALPAPAEAGFGVAPRSASTEELVVEAAFPGDADAVDFFLAGTDGYAFGTPVKAVDGNSVTFTVPVLERPENKPAGGGLPYTLTTRAGAVQGHLPYP